MSPENKNVKKKKFKYLVALYETLWFKIKLSKGLFCISEFTLKVIKLKKKMVESLMYVIKQRFLNRE